MQKLTAKASILQHTISTGKTVLICFYTALKMRILTNYMLGSEKLQNDNNTYTSLDRRHIRFHKIRIHIDTYIY